MSHAILDGKPHRQIIGILKPELATQLGWMEVGYSNIILAFQIAIAAGAYLINLRIVHLINPHLEPMEFTTHQHEDAYGHK